MTEDILILAYVLLCGMLAAMDIKTRTLPNIILLPVTVTVCLFTHNWLWVGLMLCVGLYLFDKNIWCGGDAKLMMMGAAFTGWKIIPIFFIAKIFIWVYRMRIRSNNPLPYTPFVLCSSVVFLYSYKLIQFYC